MKKMLFILIFLIPFLSLFVTASKTFNIDPAQLASIENKYGSSAKKRVEMWVYLVVWIPQ